MMKNKHVLVITDSFKGSLSSLETGNAMAKGIRKALDDMHVSMDVLVFPAADGGEGTADAVCTALHGRRKNIDTVDLLGHPMTAAYGELPGEIPTAILDMAECCGIGWARQYKTTPMDTTTYGVGRMIDALIAAGYRRILVGLGGSGTNDGGTGALAALGAVFTDRAGQVLDMRCGGKMLSEIAGIGMRAVYPKLAGVELILLYDAAVPLTGSSGAVRMFGRQKGASPQQLDLLEEGMCHYAQIITEQYGAAIPLADGSGAAGGLGCGLHLAGGRLCHGASYILETLGMTDLLQNADIVFTGEGKTDLQTVRGKLPHTVARYAKAAGVPCVDICGQAEPVEQLYTDGMTAVVSLLQGCIPLEESMMRTAELAEKTAYNLMRLRLAAR